MEGVLHIEGNFVSIKGATKVVSSTSNQAVVEMGEKMVILSGEQIEVKKLNLEEGEVSLAGDVSNIKFTEASGRKGSLLKRIFK